MFFVATGYGWWPSLNPLGSWSATAALISAAACFLADRHFLKSERAHGWLTLILPISLLSFVFYSKVHVDESPIGLEYDWADWRMHAPNAQDFFADYIFIGVGLVLAWKAARLRARDLRVLGFIIFAAAVVFLALEVGMLSHYR